jgi:hypothetical protein
MRRTVSRYGTATFGSDTLRCRGMKYVSNGEVRQEFTFVYAAESESGELKIDDKSKQAAWVPLSSAVELPLAKPQRRRLKDVMEYQKERRTFLR